MTREDLDFISSMNMCDEISNEAYKKIVCHCEEQNSILDKIKAEIEELDEYYDNDYFSGNIDAMYKCNEVLQIIDKYKAESEEE